MNTELLSENLKPKGILGELGIEGSEILKLILNKLSGRA
jgi:hypothetical protein